MKTVSISVDVWCDYNNFVNPAYRVYVDKDLLTERTFIWKSASQFVREHIEVNVDTGEHTLRIVNLSPETAKFRLENLQVDGVAVDGIVGAEAKFSV